MSQSDHEPMVYVKQYKLILDEYEIGNQQSPPFSKLHNPKRILQRSQTLSNNVPPEKRTEKPWYTQ